MRVNEHHQAIGDPVPGWAPRPPPTPVTLAGRLVRLEPVGPTHAPQLYAAVCGPGTAPLWTYRTQDRPADQAELAAQLGRAAADPDTVTFAIVPLATGVAQGLATLMRAEPQHGCVEVGSILYGTALQRTPAATEAMALLARHVFEDLGYRRYEWKCDSANEPSRRAAARLGFHYEGRFRQAMVYHGRNRDTDWFSITDADWPAVRAAYDAWLDPANFDAKGGQRARLADLVPPRRPSPTHEEEPA